LSDGQNFYENGKPLMSFTTFVSMVSTADNSKLFLNNFYKLLKLKLFVYISQLRKSIPCGSIYSGRGGDNILSSERGTYERNSILSGWGNILGYKRGGMGKDQPMCLKKYDT
jgi:hypothetical protein